MATRQAASSPEEGGRRPRGHPAAGAASPPVLLLRHFCTVPFLCFGDVRVGASRTRSLVLHNPHGEPLQVEPSLVRAAAQGFSVSPNRCELKPKEKITVSVTWTPLKEGRVREVVTFLVNDFLKHQAILLGNAEEHRKKKRSLWNTNKKILASSRHTKRTSKNQNFNESFIISQKVDRIRSPLQACENLTMSECCSPTENNSLSLEENKIPTSSISPIKECQSDTCLPQFFSRSTAYSSLHASENAQHLKVQDASVSKDFNFSEEVTNETFLNPVGDQSEGESKFTLAPSCSSPLNVTQSQINFLSPDSFVKNSCASDNGLGLKRNVSSDTFRTDHSDSLCLESQTVHKVYQTILSPDSFLNDNYGLKKGLKSESVNPISPPTQFVKDNMVRIGQQTCKLAAVSSKSHQDWRINEGLAYNSACQHSETPKVSFEKQSPIEMKSHYHGFTKQNSNISEFQDASLCNQSEQPKRRPILSATVTKRKPTNARKNLPEIDKPNTKKCLKDIVGECGKEMGDSEEKGFHSYLPVVKPVMSKRQSSKNEVTPSTILSSAPKRKSSGIMEDTSGKLAVTEHTEVCEIKRIHFSPLKSTLSTVARTKRKEALASRHINSSEKSSLRKKTDSLVLKTPLSKTKKRTRPVVGIAQSHLTFIKPLKAAIPRHPMPFAAKNMFYDERWKEKQEQGFTWWLNYVLTPDDFNVKTSVSEVNTATLVLGMENQHKISVPKAPTKDEASLRAYTASCRLNRLRRTACSLFTSEKMVKAIKKLEIEIELGRLIVRKDRHLWKDIGQRQKVLNWLLSYNPLWLRIGLETVYGELIPLADNSDVTGLAMFILNRLLWNPDIAAEYRHPTVPLLFRDGHEAALSKFTLKKLLLLVCFLDHAKLSRLIDHDPCLFCKDAEFKASKELLLAFSRDFLSGEGDLSRHLSLLGLPVSHVQTPLDEFDFAVTNLAVDLQCGVRLVRAMELLTQNWSLSEKLRIPAISRVQKMHNVDIVLQVLKSRGVQLTDEHGNTILSKDIVDRHREKTLGLLWKIAFAFQVDISLNLDHLKEEIDFLKRTHSIKTAISALTSHSQAVANKQKDKRNSGSFEHYGNNVKLLMDWVNAVCAFYNIKVENFTVSFSDGRVLCYLIHHYHPCYVPIDAICQRTTQSVSCAQTGSVVLNSSSESEGSCLNLSLEALDHENTPDVYKELLENEKKNFHVVRSAARDLGGIPAMIHHSDMSNTIPDEKVVITYLSFLCARLLDLRKEIRAARLIQATWRKYKLKRDLKHHQERDKAARIIQSVVLSFLSRRRLQKKVRAAEVIQKWWRRVTAQRKLLMLKNEKLAKLQRKSALLIQAVWRTYKAKKYLSKVEAACRIQAWYRCWRARKGYVALLKAVKIIEGYICAKLERMRFLKMRASAIIIQRKWRATLSTRVAHKNLILKRHRAACLIQAHFRGYKERQSFLQQRSAVLIIQRWIRALLSGKRERMKYIKFKKSTVVLQALVRGWLVRKKVSEQRAKIRLLHFTAAAYCHMCAFRIQRAYRFHMAVRNAAKHVNSVIFIQRWFRRRLQQKKLIEQYHKIIKTEREVQECQLRQNKAASVIQKAVRHFLLRRKQKKMNNSATRIQALWRGYSWRKKNDHTEIKAIRLSLRAVSKNVEEENKLYRRTARALHHLLTYKHLSAILDALKHLEVVTRLSPLCCENMAESGAISTIFVVIRSCNRSVPCMEVVGYAVQVLLNVAKYDKTISAVYDAENCVDTLLELLQMYREKPGDRVPEKSASIFTRTCCLLAVLLKTEHCASDAHSRSKVIDRIYRLYKFTVPKHKMNKEGLFDKQKQNSYTGFACISERSVKTRIILRLKPQWVLRRDNMEEITNSVQAIQLLMDTLGIPYQ
ncbi:abnormal spindle-like microcephaly-associated protein [Psammomys obesus]|uniref:abnormal spindle-like microcephaly-associated protein n=1 Tax=Psammomys obesus TaxID=48139 RepID=UPI002452F492|nr:abnormal spindle-like microcephaly-associated protein [Psammomys obesus]